MGAARSAGTRTHVRTARRSGDRELGSAASISSRSPEVPRSARRGAATGILALAALVAVVALLPEAEATHYRWGVLSWEPTGVENEVRFTGNHGWRRSAYGYPNVGDLVITGSLDPGDGASLSLRVKVTTISVENDWFIGKFVNETGAEGFKHRYSAPNNGGQPWVAYYESCCRISPHSSGNYHVNNPDLSQSLETLVDLAGEPNSSPKTILRPINQCPVESDCLIYVPVADVDDDELSFRLATPAEAAGGDPFVQPGPPHAANAASIGATDGIIRWDTRGATYSETEHTLYSMAIMVEDGRTKTPLDFFIELVPPGVVPPYWVIPPSACGATLTIGIGASFEFDVMAASEDPQRVVTINHLGLPDGADFPLPPPGNPTSGTFRWTPTHDQAGSHLVVFFADDDRGYQAPICPVTLIVLTGDYEAWGFGVTVEADDVSVSRQPFAHVRDPLNATFAHQQVGPVNVTGLAFAFDGNATFPYGLYFGGHAEATSLAGRISIPGVLEAEGVSMHVESVVDEQGAESWSELSIARLRIAGVEVDAGYFSGPHEFRIPGVAKIRVHERVDTGDAVLNANVTAYAFHVEFERPSPVRDVYVLGATANVGLHVRGLTAGHGIFDHLRGEPLEAGKCVEVAERTRQERLPSPPLVIEGDEQLLELTAGADDGLPLVLQDLDILVPAGGQGIVLRGTTLPLVIRNVRLSPAPYDPAAPNGPGPWAGIVLENAARVTLEGVVIERMDVGVVVDGARLPSIACTLFTGQRVAGVTVAAEPDFAGETLAITGSRFFAQSEPSSAGVLFAAPPTGARVAVTESGFRGLGKGGVLVRAPAGEAWTGATVALVANDFHASRGGGIRVDGPVASSTWSVVANQLTDADASLVGIFGATDALSLVLEGNVLRATGGGALDLHRDATALTLAGGGNAGVDVAASLVRFHGNLSASTVALRGGAIANALEGVFDFDARVDASDVRIADVGAAGLARDLVRFAGPVADSSVTLDGLRVADTSGGTVDFLDRVDRSAVTIAGSLIANLVADGGGSGIAFRAPVAASTLRVVDNVLAGNPCAGLALHASFDGEMHVLANLFLLNQVAGVILTESGGGAPTPADGGGGGGCAAGATDSLAEARGAAGDATEVTIAENVLLGAGTGSRFAHGVWIDGARPGALEIRSNLVARNADGVRLTRGANAAVTGNTFTDNDRGVAAVHEEGLYVTSVLRDNHFARNAFFGVEAEWAPGAPDLDARENWWGHHTGPSGGGASGSGDRVSDYVLFEPWHLTPLHALLGRLV